MLVVATLVVIDVVVLDSVEVVVGLADDVVTVVGTVKVVPGPSVTLVVEPIETVDVTPDTVGIDVVWTPEVEVIVVLPLGGHSLVRGFLMSRITRIPAITQVISLTIGATVIFACTVSRSLGCALS